VPAGSAVRVGGQRDDDQGDHGNRRELDMTENDGNGVDRDRDGVASMRDVEAEQGDEEGVEDLFILDEAAAREIDADLLGDKRDEPQLD
jgi:hypothetical protein